MTTSTADSIDVGNLATHARVNSIDSDLETLLVVIAHEIVQILDTPLAGEEIRSSRELENIGTLKPAALITRLDASVAVAQNIGEPLGSLLSV
eukprot:11477477-Heterocapsa_arctica.AAC.1